MIEAFRDRFGIRIIQGWGMTETSPLAAVAIPPAGTLPEAEIDYRVKAGRVVAGVELRLAAEDGTVLPNDGKTVGEFEIRGPWITASYFGLDDPEKFRDGWLRTGDVGTLDGEGLHGHLGPHQGRDQVRGGVDQLGRARGDADEPPGGLRGRGHRGARRQVAGAPAGLRGPQRGRRARPPRSCAPYLADKVAKWWLPEHWCFVDAVPKTSVGKFDKKVLRARHAAGELDVVTLA